MQMTKKISKLTLLVTNLSNNILKHQNCNLMFGVVIYFWQQQLKSKIASVNEFVIVRWCVQYCAWYFKNALLFSEMKAAEEASLLNAEKYHSKSRGSKKTI